MNKADLEKASDTLDHITDKAKPLVDRMFESRFSWAFFGISLVGWVDIIFRIYKAVT